MNGVNLLPSTVLAARAQKRRRSLWARSLVVYCCVILIGLLVADGALVQPIDALEAESIALDSDLTATEAGAALLAEREVELKAELRVLKEIYGQPDWSVLLLHLGERLTADAKLRSVRVSLAQRAGEAMTPGHLARGPYRLELSGAARSQSDVTKYVLRLERAGLLDEVTLEGTSPTRLADGDGVLFSIVAVLRVEPE